MFESIKCTSSSASMTTACYVDGDVIGEVAFHAKDNTVRIFSEIGPDDHLRECIAIYRFNPTLGFHRSIVKDEINSYA